MSQVATTVDSGVARAPWIVGGTEIGENSPPFLVAEIGLNHNGSIALARELVDAAADAGAHAVKFQLRDMATIYGTNAHKKLDIGASYIRDALIKYSLSADDTLSVMEFSQARGIMAFCTPFDLQSLDLLDGSSVDAIKLSSSSLINHTFLARAIQCRYPLVMSTGLSHESEIIGALRLVRGTAGRNQVALLHCNSTYPAAFKDLNLLYIKRLMSLFDGVVGYSGHERGLVPSLVAIALGARIIERHLTLDTNMQGPDHKASLTPREFSELALNSSIVYESLGNQLPRTPSQGEKNNRVALSQSLHFARDVKKGDSFRKEDFQILAPGHGIEPYRMTELVGRIALEDYRVDTPVFESAFGEAPWSRKEFSLQTMWGVPVRPHDLEELINVFEPPLVEFHLGRDDMTLDISSVGSYPECHLIVHSPDVFADDFLLDLSSLDEAYRLHSVRLLQQVVDFTQRLSRQFPNSDQAKVVASLGGFSVNKFIEDDEKSARYAQLALSLQDLQLRDTRLLAQTLPPFPWYFGGQYFCNLFVDPEETARFCAEHELSICLDTSHTQMAANYNSNSLEEGMRVLQPHVGHLHIADALGVSGEGIQIGEGSVDFDAVREIFLSSKSGPTWIPEIWQGHLGGGGGYAEALRRLANLGF